MPKGVKSRRSFDAKAQQGTGESRPLTPKSSGENSSVQVPPRQRGWWETWWGNSILLTTTAIIAGVVLWQMSEHFSKRPSLASVSQETFWPGGRIKSLTMADGIRMDFSNSGPLTSITSEAGPVSPEAARNLAKEVERAQSGPLNLPEPTEPTEVPPALDPGQRTFVVDRDVTAVANGAECNLTSGDVITRLTDTPDADQAVRASVSASKKSDCTWGQTVAVKVDDLQEMYDHFIEALNNGLGEIGAKRRGEGGVHKASNAGTSASDVPPPPPDKAAEKILKEQQAAADKAEQSIKNPAQNDQH